MQLHQCFRHTGQLGHGPHFRKILMPLFRTILALLCLAACTLCHAEDSIPQKKSFGAAFVGGLKSIIREFNNIDTSYIEPQHYKFSTMVQSTYFFERYRITSKSGQTITFAPETRIKVGPYAGWSLLFLGYTIDLAYISANKKRELDLSLYSSMIGVDLFYGQGCIAIATLPPSAKVPANVKVVAP